VNEAMRPVYAAKGLLPLSDDDVVVEESAA
jgi:hypothetical protein